MVTEGGSLAGELRELVFMERRIQILNDDSAASLALLYLEDDRGVSWVDLADLVVAGWNRSNVGSLISFARAISMAHPGFLEMVDGKRFRGLFAKSWASAFPELPVSRALVCRLGREKTVCEEGLAAEVVESAELQLRLIREGSPTTRPGSLRPWGLATANSSSSDSCAQSSRRGRC
jgi:hypothetical protein